MSPVAGARGCRQAKAMAPDSRLRRIEGSGFSIRINQSGAAVIDGNIGGITMSNTTMDAGSITVNRFSATRSGSTWTIRSLP